MSFVPVFFILPFSFAGRRFLSRVFAYPLSLASPYLPPTTVRLSIT